MTGRRFWVLAVLEAIEELIRKPRRVASMKDEANNIMCQLWLDCGRSAGVYGYEDETNHPFNIMAGDKD